jgi:hypothetical protein
MVLKITKLEEAYEKQNLELRTGNNWKIIGRAKGGNTADCNSYKFSIILLVSFPSQL